MQPEEAVKNAARILNAGGVAVIPTDTVYGIAAHPAHPEAVRRIQTIKGRPAGKPIALLASDMAAVRAFGAVFPPGAERLAERYWPGALTLVLPCGDGYEGFRVPDFPLTRRLLALCGGTLRVTSANVSGGQPALSAAQSLRDVGLEADLVVDGGAAPGGTASTVVKFDPPGRCTVLREGPVALEILNEEGKQPCKEN